jgi:hypothetical protein
MKDISKYMTILKFALALIGVIVCLFLFGGPASTEELSAIETFRDGAKMTAATYYTMFILVGCIALILIFFFTQLISNPKRTLMSIIGIVASLVLYVILYSIGTTDTAESLGLINSIGDVPDSTIRSTTAGLYVVFIGLAVALLAILAGKWIGKVIK